MTTDASKAADLISDLPLHESEFDTVARIVLDEPRAVYAEGDPRLGPRGGVRFSTDEGVIGEVHYPSSGKLTAWDIWRGLRCPSCAALFEQPHPMRVMVRCGSDYVAVCERCAARMDPASDGRAPAERMQDYAQGFHRKLFGEKPARVLNPEPAAMYYRGGRVPAYVGHDRGWYVFAALVTLGEIASRIHECEQADDRDDARRRVRFRALIARHVEDVVRAIHNGGLAR